MDVDTLLTRQMELHTSVRHPPKNPQGLVQLMDIMRNYKNYFESLRKTAEQFKVEPETVFQAFMYISVGGAVNFDRQHQDGSVPMHQAKVLARSNAIELSTTLRQELPNSELMVYVGLSRDLRTTLRVKVEDGNDLKTAEASVLEAVEYLNYIDRCAHHNPERLFRFYMAEDPNSLTALLNESDPLSMTQTMNGSTMRGSGLAQQAGGGGGGFDESGSDAREPTPLPSPLSLFLVELKRQCALACETSAASGAATRRLKAAQVVLDWVTAVPAEYFAEHTEKIVAAVSTTLSLLATEKRSALCRVGCEVITVLVQRLSPEPVFLDDVHRGTCSMNPETFSGALAQWTASLAKGTYVTVAAISTSADAALRTVAIASHGHLCVVKKLLAVLSSGTQTELRRKCLGYLALCVVAAHAHRSESVRELMRLLAPVAVEYVSIGDSPSRKMARALCSVLRVLAPDASPTSRGALFIADERVEQLVQQERPQVEPAVLGGPRDLEELLFEADAFVSSTRSSFSNSRQSSGVGGSVRGRGRGGGVVGSQRSSLSSHDGGAAASNSTSASSVVPGVRHSGSGELVQVSSSPFDRHAPVRAAKPGPTLGDLRSPVRRGAPSTGTAAAPSPSSTSSGQRRVHDGPRAAGGGVAGGTGPLSHHNQSLVNADYGVYDTDSFLGGDSVPKKNARAEEGRGAVPVSGVPRASPGQHIHASAPHFPSLSAQPRRSTGAASGNPHPDALHGNARDAHRHGAAPTVADRPVPLSLREGGSEAVGATSSDGAGVARISRALRRKIDENKSGGDHQ